MNKELRIKKKNCHPERSEGSLVKKRFFAQLRMTMVGLFLLIIFSLPFLASAEVPLQSAQNPTPTVSSPSPSPSTVEALRKGKIRELTTSEATDITNNPPFNLIGSGILSVMGKVFGFIILGITYFIGYIGGVAFTFSGLFLAFGLKLNGTLLQSPTVNVGWTITRDIANLGFVVAIIFIAFATILRLQTYNMGKNLIRLVIAALLVNFSLVIAGLFIDMSGLMTNFFVAKVVPPTSSAKGVLIDNPIMFSTNIANVFGVQKALQTSSNAKDQKEFAGATEFTPQMIKLLASLFFTTVFTITGATVMFTVALLVYVRYVMLTGLLIMMPLAALGWVFPGTQLGQAWSTWWEKFLTWIMWLPIATFFIYLTILLVNNQANDPNSVTYIAKEIQNASQGGTVLDNFFGVLNGVFATFGRGAAVIGLLGFGMYAAEKLSSQGGKGVVNFAKSGQKYLMGAAAGGFGAGALARYGGRRGWQAFLRGGGAPPQINPQTGQPIPGSEKLSIGQRLSNNLVKYGKYVGLAGQGSALSGYIAGGSKEVTAYQSKYLSGLSDEAVINWPELIDPEAKAAKINELAKRGKVDKLYNEILKKDPEKLGISNEQLKGLTAESKNALLEETIKGLDSEKRNALIGPEKNKYLEAIRQYDLTKDYLNVKVDDAGYFGKTERDILSKHKDVTEVSEESLKSARVLAALSAKQRETLEQSEKLTEEARKNFKKIFDDLTKNATEFAKFVDAAKKFGTADDFLMWRPKHASQFGKSHEEVMAKITDLTRVHKDSLVDRQVLAALNEKQFQDMSTNRKITPEIKSSIKEAIKEFAKDLRDYPFISGRPAITIEEGKIMTKIKKMEDIVNSSPIWSTEKRAKQIKEEVKTKLENEGFSKKEIKDRMNELRANLEIKGTAEQEIQKQIQEATRKLQDLTEKQIKKEVQQQTAPIIKSMKEVFKEKEREEPIVLKPAEKASKPKIL